MTSLLLIVAEVAARHAEARKVGLRLAISFKEDDDIGHGTVRAVFGPPLYESITFDADVKATPDILRDWIEREFTRLMEST